MKKIKWKFSEEWILERYKCFGKFDELDQECTEFCSKQIMKNCKNKSIIYWEERLKEDLYYIANLKLYMYHFHDETNGISIRKGAFTKTFKKWLLEQNIGDFLLKEIERRKEVNIKCLTPKNV